MRISHEFFNVLQLQDRQADHKPAVCVQAVFDRCLHSKTIFERPMYSLGSQTR